MTQGANVEREPRQSRPTPAPAAPAAETRPRTTDAFRAIGSPAVAAAAERVLATWTNALGDAINLDEVRDALAWLAAMVDRAASGEPVGDAGPVANVLGRHLLTLLRADLVRNWATTLPGRAENLLDILRAIEDAHDAIDPDWSQYFSSRLSGPDGLDLVVEVAHDLRSPVTSILFLAETLGRAQSGEVNELQRRQLRLIYSAALGLSSMASDVIELARGGEQVVERDVSPFSVSEVVESVLDMVRPIAEEKGLELRFAPLSSDHRLGRPLLLSRVLLNLTTNALKFTDEGSVEITARAHGLTRVEFSVRDTGHGISEEALANLFQPFRRTRARAGRSGYYFSGTGLGLAMCRKLIEAVGSELRFETKAGGGTRFFFDVDLPLATSIG